MAVNWRESPLATDGVVGVTAIDASVAAVTVSVVEPVTPLSVAEIDVGPTPGGEGIEGSASNVGAALVVDARPREPTALLMVAFVVSLDAQVTLVVRFCVLASV